MSFKIIAIGELLWDLLPTKKVLGGAPANFAYHIRPEHCWRMLCNECLPPELKLMGVADHGVSEAIYLRDLDNNGLELYWITTNSMAENSRSKKQQCLPGLCI